MADENAEDIQAHVWVNWFDRTGVATTEHYTFDTQEEADAFKYGLDESVGRPDYNYYDTLDEAVAASSPEDEEEDDDGDLPDNT